MTITSRVIRLERSHPRRHGLSELAGLTDARLAQALAAWPDDDLLALIQEAEVLSPSGPHEARP